MASLSVYYNIGSIGGRIFGFAFGNAGWIKLLLIEITCMGIYLVPMKYIKITSLMVHLMESQENVTAHKSLIAYLI